MSAGTAVTDAPSVNSPQKKIRLGQRVRSKILIDLKKNLSSVEAVVVSRIDRVPTFELNQLRQSLGSLEVSFFIVKNSLCRIAFRELGWESLEKSIEGTCAISPIRGEISTSCKLLGTFSKEHEGFLIQGGLVSGQILSGKELVEIGKLPSRDQLLSQLAGIAQSPLRRFAFVVQAPLRSMVLILEAVKQKKSAPLFSCESKNGGGDDIK